MAVDFEKFDKKVNAKELKAQMESAPEFDNTPVAEGTYIAKLKSMEVKETKDHKGLILAVSMQIKENCDGSKDEVKRYVFWNRKIFGNDFRDNWNDGIAIKGALTWINKLGYDPIDFTTYAQLAEDVLETYQAASAEIEIKINWDPDGFNPIEIVDVIDA